MRAPARWRRRLGRRGTALLCCGLPWILYGIGLMTTPRAGLTRAASPITTLMSLHCWGIVWVACGSLACAAALLRPGKDLWGFAAAVAPPSIWTLTYLAAAVTGEYRQAWAGTPLLLPPVLLLVVIAEATGRRRPNQGSGYGS